MKNSLTFKWNSTFALLLTLLTSSFCGADSTLEKPQRINYLPEKVFIPPSFDDNDNAQVVIFGHFPNTCYRAHEATAQINYETKQIKISNSAYFYADPLCLKILVPFMQTINLGTLSTGEYEVSATDDQNQLHRQGLLSIKTSMSLSPDDYLYAPVGDAFLEKGQLTSNPTLVIQGEFRSNCMSMREIQVRYQKSENIVEILPIATMRENESCQPQSKAFTSRVALNIPWTGSTLIYVRSLNGQAVSKVIVI